MDKSEDITLEEKPSLGKSLSWARTRRELTQQDIAEELNLGKDIINALENDEPIEGVSPTYVRGYQRSYIRFLELDENELLAENSASTQFKGTHENLQVIDKNMLMRGSGGGFSFPFRYFMPLLVIGLVIIYWPQISSMFSRDDSQQTTQAATVKQETDTEVIQTFEIKPASTETTVTTTVVTEANQEETIKEPDESNPDEQTGTEIDESDQVTVSKVVDPTASPTDDPVNTENNQNEVDDNQTLTETEVASAEPQETHSNITFIANGESWLDIRDAENTRLFRNTLKLDRITVTGVLPLRIRTGNLQALRVQANQGEQRKVDVFDDSTIVANFLVEKDDSGRLKFTAQ